MTTSRSSQVVQFYPKRYPLSFARFLSFSCCNLVHLLDRLYWVTSAESPTGITSFNVDNRIRYIRYSKDFGPVSLAAIVNFCRVVRKNIAFDDDSSKSPKNPVYFHSSIDPEKRANAALLIACFQVIPLRFHQQINSSIGIHFTLVDAVASRVEENF